MSIQSFHFIEKLMALMVLDLDSREVLWASFSFSFPRDSSQFVTFEMMCAETDENENEDSLVNSIYIWI